MRIILTLILTLVAFCVEAQNTMEVVITVPSYELDSSLSAKIKDIIKEESCEDSTFLLIEINGYYGNPFIEIRNYQLQALQQFLSPYTWGREFYICTQTKVLTLLKSTLRNGLPSDIGTVLTNCEKIKFTPVARTAMFKSIWTKTYEYNFLTQKLELITN